MSNQAEQITQAKMDELIRKPYQLLEERVLELETERDEINQKLDRVAEILLGLRVAFGDMPMPEVEKETEGGPE